ncbi:Rap1a/Tai family immunity protein [Pseudomonas lini]
MKSKMMCTLALLATGWTGHVLADGNALLQQCKDALTVMDGGTGKSPFGGGVCLGKIDGTIDGIEVARGYYSAALGKTLSPFICWPKEPVAKEQQVRIVVKYLKEHPESLHESEASLITLAMAFAFPCGKA